MAEDRAREPLLTYPVATALICLLVLVCAFVALLFLQEVSLVRACARLMQAKAGWCVGGAEGLDAAALNETSVATLLDAIAKGSETFAPYYGFLAALAGVALALIVVALLPADQIQFTGDFGKDDNRVRIGGAAGLMAAFAAAGGFLAWTAIPSSERVTVLSNALASVSKSQRDLLNSNAQLTRHLGERTDDFAFTILSNGYFTQMNGAFSVVCAPGDEPTRGADAATVRTDGDELFVRIPQSALDIEQRLDAGTFHVPLDALRRRVGRGDSAFPTVGIRLVKDRASGGQDVDTLASMNFTLTPGDGRDAPMSREVRMRTRIYRHQVDEYCDRRGGRGRHVVGASPLAGSGG